MLRDTWHATEEGLAVDYFVSHFWGHPFEVGSGDRWFVLVVDSGHGLVVHLAQDSPGQAPPLSFVHKLQQEFRWVTRLCTALLRRMA
jgi:hypothetical protein